MVAFRSATVVASLSLLAALAWAPSFGAQAPDNVPAKIRWLDTSVSWDTANRRGLLKAQMEIEVKREGFPVLGLKAAPSLVHWDGSALHPTMLSEVSGKRNWRVLKVRVEPGTLHRLDIEYERELEKVDAVPVSTETSAVPLVFRFDDPQIPDHELQTNGLALPAGEGKWAVRFAESSEGIYLALPEEDRKPGSIKKIVRWFFSLPYMILGGGGEGPPPLISFHKKN